MVSPIFRNTVLGLFLTSAATQAQLIYNEEFDGTGAGYNLDSSTALVGDDDWVDFNNNGAGERIGASGIGTMVEGYTTASTGETILAGASIHNDPQVRADFSPGLDQSDIGKIELRIRVDIDQNLLFDDPIVAGDVLLYWGSISYGNPGATNAGAGTNTNFGEPDSIVTQSDGWHLLTWDDVGGLGVGDVNSFRIDPTNGGTGNGDSFEIDFLRIEQSTVVPPTPPVVAELDPVDPIGAEFTLRQSWEWDTPGDQEGWTAGGNGLFTITGVASSLLTGDSSGNDPQLASPDFQVFDVESGRFVIEFGLTTDAADTASKQLFWALNGGNFSGANSVVFPVVPAGGNHVVRITFTDAINDQLTGLRYDPSNTGSITTNIDYIRIYSEGPEILPPSTSLDNGPLATDFPPVDEWILQEEWHWLVDGELDGWTAFNFDVETEGMIASSIVTGVALTNDPRWTSPDFSINAPSSGRFVVELGLQSDPLGTDTHDLRWGDNSGNPNNDRLVPLPKLPSDGGSTPHVVRVLFDGQIDTTLDKLRYDPVNQAAFMGIIDYIRVYTDGPPISTDPPQITALTYDPITGDAEVTLEGAASTVYSFVSAADLDFNNSSAITLTGATVGTLSGVGVETDGTGNATVQCNLGLVPKNFLRAE